MPATDRQANYRPWETAAAPAALDRAVVADEFSSLLPAVRRTLESLWPADIREELAAVTFNQCEALGALVDAGSLSMNDLARHQKVSLSSCTALADRLIRQGLAERVADPADRRVVRLRPTAHALRFVERFRSAKRASTLALLAPLDDAEAEQLLGLIRKMAGAVSPPAGRD